ncbi:MAG: hypothetical protein OXC26_05755 [Albidovulum sp.]|nr:hypothetical protein [Albidovulum sp.]
MFNLQTPFFVPVWRRALTTAICLVWTLFELLLGNPGWALIFGAVGGWCVYQFFVVWKDPEDVSTDE